jgi:type I restriction enzyme, S subunit
MSEWARAPFGDLYAEASRNGISIPKATRGEGVPMVNMKELFAHDFISDQHTERVPATEDQLRKWGLEDGDLLFGRRSLTLAGAGKISIVKRPTHRAVFESSVIRTRLDRSLASPEFYFYLFKSAPGRQIMETIVEQVAVAGIRSSDLAKLRVPVPPLHEQRRIASVLGALDDLIETNRALVRDLAGLQLMDFKSAWDGECRVRLAAVAAVTMGQSPPGETYNETGDGTPFYQGTRDFGWRYPARRVWTTQATRLAEAGDVLVAVRAPVGELNVATETTALGRGLGGLRASRRQATLLQALHADSGLWDMHQGTGTVFASINKAGMSELSIPWVDDHGLEVRLADLDQAILDLTHESNSLTRTRDELLPLLMSGKVRVADREVA